MVDITTVGTAYLDRGDVTVDGHGNPWTTPIFFSGTLVSSGQPVSWTVFCDDLDDVVYVGGGQHLSYKLETLNFGNTGIHDDVLDKMAQLAGMGEIARVNHDEDGAIAAQAAIWGLEYGIGVSSSDHDTELDIEQDLTITALDNGPPVWGLVAQGGTQSQLIGFQASPDGNGDQFSVPEPAEWAMLCLGVGLVGSSLRMSRRRQVETSAAA
ncbi:MAG TPA: PEPxxWA-CTERM sorting domain-containing protein [Caulobacteraceae bacterium]